MIRIPALTEFLRDAKTILHPLHISDRQNRAVNLLQNTSEYSPTSLRGFSRRSARYFHVNAFL